VDFVFIENNNNKENILQIIILFSNSIFLIYDVEDTKLSKFSENNNEKNFPVYLTQFLSSNLNKIFIIKNNNNNEDENKLLIYNSNSVVLINLNEKIPEKIKIICMSNFKNSFKSNNKKYKYCDIVPINKNNNNINNNKNNNFVLFENIYKNLIHVGLIQNNKMVFFFSLLIFIYYYLFIFIYSL
jgi:hypothetical protein